MPSHPSRRRRRTIAVDGPDPIDVHVGSRLRLLRTLRGLSQSALASLLGLTFQQVQKYENGGNRISASTLHRLTVALDVPVGFFFDDLPDRPLSPSPDDALFRRESLDLLRRYYGLPDAVRRSVYDMVKALAGQEG